MDYFWELFLKGDDKSFNIIYLNYIDNLLHYGNKLCSDKNLVEDCIQEIFIDLYLKRSTISFKINNLKSYLFVSLRNNIIKKIDQNKKHQELGNNDLYFDVEYSFEDKVIETEISENVRKELRACINNLPPRQKEIIYLKFEEEMEYSEISEILIISVDSARKLLHRALTTLRKTLKKNEFPLLLLFFSKKEEKVCP